jgi:uncharacterized membrane protein YccC
MAEDLADNAASRRTAIVSSWLRARLATLRVELGFSFRVTVAALLTLILAQMLHLPLAIWAVMTAVIVTQTSVGRSVKVTMDYLAGTLGGALYAGAVAALVPARTEIELLGALAIAVAPAAMVATIYPRFSVAPLTAVMVLLAPTITSLSPLESAFLRMIEVAVGGIVALLVSFLVMPAQGGALVRRAAASVLVLMAQALPRLLADRTPAPDARSVQQIQDEIGQALASLDLIGAEAQRERVPLLEAEPTPGPLVRTLLRLRHDFVMIGRAALVPLPDALRDPLGPPLACVAETVTTFLRDCSAALAARQPPPSRNRVEQALHNHAGAIAALRRKGLTRDLTDDAMERLFARGFAFEQMHRNLADLERCISEFARSTAGRKNPA